MMHKFINEDPLMNAGNVRCPDSCGPCNEKIEAIHYYLKHYHRGKDAAVHSSELERLFSISGRGLRRMVSKLRQEGCPICSDETGYYYAENQHEINRTVGWLNDLVTGVSNARTGLLYAKTFPDNMRIDLYVHLEGDENYGGEDCFH